MIGRGVYEDDETVARNQLEALLASGTDRQIPAVTDLFSLRTAIRYADSHPHTRFVAVKGAAALGRIDGLWALGGPGLYADLVHRRSWTDEQYCHWLSSQLQQALRHSQKSAAHR